jgi:hypothetical protein
MQSNGELPNFLVIGAAKSGTTALFDLLAQHPQVYLPFVKEPKFFNNDANYSNGTDWYLGTFFKNASGYPARGEATPHYLYWGEKTSSRILETYGSNEVKFIAIFRDPVKRAYSQYWMDVQRKVEQLAFKDALTAEDKRLDEMRQELEPAGLLKYGYFRGGCYATLLQPYLQRFPRQIFHFLIQEDLQMDLSAAMHNLTEFLGIHSDFGFKPVVSNPAYVPRSNHLYHSFLYRPEILKRLLKKLTSLLPESQRYRIRKLWLQINRRPQTYPPLDPEVESQLRGEYQEEIKQLQTILGRDLSQWYQ